MSESTTALAGLLATLSRRARALGITDAAWAARAGVRKETLSRLRGRRGCDFETLRALAEALGVRIGVLESELPATTHDGHFPVNVDRDYEDRLVALAASADFELERWLALGPRFFMAGLAVMLASRRHTARRELLALAEELHPGASEVAVFDRWLARSPLRPTRFLSLVDRTEHAA